MLRKYPVRTSLPGGMEYSGVRELSGIIPEEELALAGLSVQIIGFDRTTRFCGVCGEEMRQLRTERAKRCPACGHTEYPRLSPAIIVLVRNADSVLMVQSKQAPPGRHSLVAGFVEPGEDLVHAVHREVMEETGIRITNVSYAGSEPWPFPNSLMIAFVADYDGNEIEPDGTEVLSAGWFRKGQSPVSSPKNQHRPVTYRLVGGKRDMAGLPLTGPVPGGKFFFTDLLFFFGIWGRQGTGNFISTRNAIIQYIKHYK